MGKLWRAFYNTRVWKQLRKHHLHHHPLCAMCQQAGHVVAATVVDHRTPHRGDWSLFTDRTNLQSLCAPHHNASKQREEARGYAIGSMHMACLSTPITTGPLNDAGV
jgi:5-methylcytosine-specific restriction enzyme A